MKDVRIDENSELRCWNCGSKGLLAKRTTRSKVLVGVGALVTKKKLKCQVCGEYNDTGAAKPWDGPASRKYRKQYEAELQARQQGARPVAATAPPPAPAPVAPPPPPTPAAALSVADEITKLVALRDAGALTEAEFAAEKARLLGQPAPRARREPLRARPPES